MADLPDFRRFVCGLSRFAGVISKCSACNTSAKLTSVLFLKLRTAMLYRILKVHVVPAIRAKRRDGLEIIRYIPINASIIAVAPAAVFYRSGTAFRYPVAVRAAGYGLQLIQRQLLDLPVTADLVPEMGDILRRDRLSVDALRYQSQRVSQTEVRYSARWISSMP